MSEIDPSPGPPRRHSFFDLLFLPLGLLLQASPLAVGIVVLLLGGTGVLLYYSLNSDFFGLAAPAFGDLDISKNFDQIKSRSDQREWKIAYESSADATFTGIVRHVSHWREYDIPFATHDVLVTSGDFADPDRVHTDVAGHRFSYSWPSGPAPQGKINLLHIVPFSEDIYRQLLGLRDRDAVTIYGREILKIDMLAADGAFLGYWQDEGCNTILVKTVVVERRE
jgi:hypothetical protein